MNNYTILCVDDEVRVKEMLSKMLSRLGYDCISAGSAAEALSILQEEHIPIVISDIRMPGKDGLQLLKKIKEKHPDSDVITITGYPDDYSFDDIMKTGSKGLLFKPFSIEELKQWCPKYS